MRRVACCVPTIAGTPSSRDTIAACEVRPPRSVIIAEAIRIIGSQSGSVIPVTNTSPFLKVGIFLRSRITLAVPVAMFDPTDIPLITFAP